MKRLLGAGIMVGLFAFAGVVSADTISGNTAAGENQNGWLFNRDTSTQSPYEFNTNQAKIGNGSLFVKPIGSNASDKFIGELFMVGTPVSDVQSVSFDFMLGNGVDVSKADQFYMSVYANFGESDPAKFYDCRYSVVATTGSTDAFTTVTFDPTHAYTVTTRTGASASPQPCPAIPADMNIGSTTGATIRVVALNVGDTSTSDAGVSGYLDNIVVTTSSGTTVYDFDPASIVNVGSGTVDIASSGTGEVSVQSGATTLTLTDSSILNLATGITSTTGSATVGGTEVVLEKAVTLQSGVDTQPVVLTNNSVSVSIPDATEISGPSTWDGTLVSQFVSASGDAPVGFSVGGTVIEIGSPNAILVLNKPITITLSGVTGTVGYKSAGAANWVQITDTCGGDYNTPADPVVPGECSIGNGTDTKIVTYHLTAFGALTAVAPVVSAGSSAPAIGSNSARRAANLASLGAGSAEASVQAGEVLGAFTGPAIDSAEIAAIKLKLVALIQELIGMLQAQLAAAIAAGGSY